MSAEVFPLQWPEGWPRHKGTLRQRPSIPWPAYQCDRVVRGLQLRRSAVIRDTGVAVYFTRDNRALVMEQDRFNTVIGNTRSHAMASEGPSR
jgi:hypothetical protein